MITTLGMHRDRKLLREIGCIFKVETRGFAKEFDIGPEREKKSKNNSKIPSLSVENMVFSFPVL